MPKRKPKLPDPNLTAFDIIQAISGESAPAAKQDDGKDPAAVALGRKGGKAPRLTREKEADAER